MSLDVTLIDMIVISEYADKHGYSMNGSWNIFFTTSTQGVFIHLENHYNDEGIVYSKRVSCNDEYADWLYKYSDRLSVLYKHEVWFTSYEHYEKNKYLIETQDHVKKIMEKFELQHYNDDFFNNHTEEPVTNWFKDENDPLPF